MRRCSPVTKMQTTTATRNAKTHQRDGCCSVDGWRISFIRRAIKDRNRVTYLCLGRFIVRLLSPPPQHPFWIFIANPAGRIYLAKNLQAVLLIILDPEQLLFESIYLYLLFVLAYPSAAASVLENNLIFVLWGRLYMHTYVQWKRNLRYWTVKNNGGKKRCKTI